MEKIVETSTGKARVVSGQRFVVILFAVMLSIAGLAIFGLSSSQHRRFAVSLSSVPGMANPGEVSADRPLLLRVEHSSSKGRNLVALAILLDADGKPLSELRPMQVGPGKNGAPTQQLEFPPLGRVPERGLLSGVVMRVEHDTPLVRARLAEALELDKPKKHQLARTFTRVIVAARELGGHAEQAQRSVKKGF